MCEKRIKRIRKGSQLARLREARRLQRMQWLASPTPAEEAPRAPVPVPVPIPVPVPDPQVAVNKRAHNRVILELAWKTLALMQKNRLIQQKIVNLQRETSEFLAAVMSNPENKQRYLENLRLYEAGLITFQPAQSLGFMPIKLEPKD